MTSIHDRLSRTTEAWRHEPGDRLVGEVVDVGSNDSGYGVYTVVTLLVDEPGSTELGGRAIEVGDERAFHAFRTVPAREFEKRRPVVGERLGVVFRGDATNRAGENYADYRVVFARPAAEPAAAVTEPVEQEGEPDDDIPF
jgi:hypothetical protein